MFDQIQGHFFQNSPNLSYPLVIMHRCLQQRRQALLVPSGPGFGGFKVIFVFQNVSIIEEYSHKL